MKEQHKVRISELCGRVDGRHLSQLDIENHTALRPDLERVKRLALDRVREEKAPPRPPLTEGETMKKAPVKLLLIAAIIALAGVTALASGGLEYFQAIFGDSAQYAREYIASPMVSEENDDYKLSVVGVLSDGYTTELVVTLESKTGSKPPRLEEGNAPMFISAMGDFGSTTFGELEEYGTKTRRVYRLELNTLESHGGEELTVTLNPDISRLEVKLPPNGTAPVRRVDIGTADAGGYRIDSIQLSAMGALVAGSETEQKGGLPRRLIQIRFTDGRVETLFDESSFDDGEETVTGGGSAVIGGPGQTLPLVIGTAGRRNPDGQVVTMASFSRLINLDEVSVVIVGDVEYPLE